MLKVAFLDRDGVINFDNGYTHSIDQFKFLEGSIAALRKLQTLGYSIVIVTNQSGIGRGFYLEAEYQKLCAWIKQVLEKEKITILDIFHCPHHPNANCECRKPQPGLFKQAARKYRIDFESSIMIGDRTSDIEAAKSAGVEQQYLIKTNTPEALLRCVSDHILLK